MHLPNFKECYQSKNTKLKISCIKCSDFGSTSLFEKTQQLKPSPGTSAHLSSLDDEPLFYTSFHTTHCPVMSLSSSVLLTLIPSLTSSAVLISSVNIFSVDQLKSDTFPYLTLVLSIGRPGICTIIMHSVLSLSCFLSFYNIIVNDSVIRVVTCSFGTLLRFQKKVKFKVSNENELYSC